MTDSLPLVLYQTYLRRRLGWRVVGGPCDAAEAIARLHYGLETGKRMFVEMIP